MDYRNIVNRIAKDIIALTTEWGFDLTWFKTGGWERVIKKSGLELEPSTGKEFTWKGNGIKVITAFNPLEENGKAGSIGVEGQESKVKEVVEQIRKNASKIKAESEWKRDFI